MNSTIEIRNSGLWGIAIALWLLTILFLVAFTRIEGAIKAIDCQVVSVEK